MFDIILSTYNGEKYLAEQLDSILNQTFNDWKLIIRDDDSTDSTLKIIQNYIDKFPNKITLIPSSGNLGPMLSFGELLKVSTSKYVAFCDQDDVWLENKLSLFIEKMIETEKKYPNTPILIHSDLFVVDKDLNIINESFWKKLGLNPNIKSLSYYLSSNNITGCSIVINDKLREIATPIPKEASMHDWWLALNASFFGVIEHISLQLIYYRQHNLNSVGAHSLFNRLPQIKYYLKKIKTQADLFSSINSIRKRNYIELIFLKVYFLILSYFKKS